MKTNAANRPTQNQKLSITDARNKIISKKRTQIVDAREKLAQLAKQRDARLKLEQLRHKRVRSSLCTTIYVNAMMFINVKYLHFTGNDPKSW